jgi:hypothetical protein
MFPGHTNPKAKDILENSMKTGIMSKNVYFQVRNVVQIFKSEGLYF